MRCAARALLALTLLGLVACDAVGDARNLSVGVVAPDSGRAKLNVSWLPPEAGRTPSFYSVSVTSVKANSTRLENGTARPTCAEGSLYYVGQSVNETCVLLPEDRFQDDTSPELEIEPGCTYRVEVFANPRRIGALPPSIIYTVPKCVGGRCNCDAAMETLPVPQVSVKSLDNGSSLVIWKLDSPSAAARVDSYKVSAGIPHLTSSSGLVVYNKTQIFAGGAPDGSFLWPHSERPRKGTKVFVSARDKHGCHGREGSYTLRRPRQSPFYKKNATALAFVGFVAVCLLLSGIFSSIKYFARNHNYKLVSLRQKSTRQLNSVLHNPKIEALLKNHNILYVDQEIEDARRKELVDEHEIPYRRLRLVRELGQGQFGQVYLADLLGPDGEEENAKPVAVKMSLTSSDSSRAQLELRQQLLEEIAITKIAGSHPHLVGLIGCCTLPSNPVCLVLEHMRGGDLLGYLHRARDRRNSFGNDGSPLESPGVRSFTSESSTACMSLDSPSLLLPPARVFFPNDVVNKPQEDKDDYWPLSRAEMLRFALEIAKGMEHLEAKGIVHRDLAARNVLMDEKLTLKISDFGLSRKDAYLLGGSGKSGVRRLPVRWMPPEAIRRRAFTSKSDVWSYGMVLWEIASLGDFPYPRLSDDALLRHLLEEGGRPDANEVPKAPQEIGRMMDMCWARKSEERPSFRQIVLWLEACSRHGAFSNLVYQEVAS